MYRHNGLLFSANGAANLLVDDPPQNAVKHQGWARDAFGYGYIKFAPQPVAYTYQGRTYTRDGALIVTGATPGARNDYADGYGALCRADGALYIGNPSGNRKNQGWLINPNGSAAIDGFGFFLGLGDKGSGEVNLVPEFGTGSATFTRATPATTVNSAGLIVSVASGVPRSWYWPDTLVYGGYLAEPARTNLCLQSEDISTTWANVASTESVDATTAPDGAATADKIEETAVSDAHYVQQTFVKAAAATAYAYSIWIKASDRTFAWMQIDDNAGNGAVVFFNLSTGAISSAAAGFGTPFTSISANIIAYPSGWYRCALLSTSNTATDLRITVGPSPDGTTQSYLGVAGSGIFVWGAQLEAGSYATSYIPTTTASVTRNADVLTYPFTGNADATQGTAYAELGAEWATSPNAIAIGVSENADGTVLGRTLNGDSSGIAIRDGTSVCIKTGLTNLLTGSRKRATSWGGSGLAATGDGATPATTAFDGAIGSAGFGVGCTPAGAAQWSGPIKNVAIYRKQLADAQLIDMT